MTEITKCLLLIIFLLFTGNIYSQDYNSDKVVLANYVTRVYNNVPFTGVKVIETYNKNYLISVVILDKDKYTNSSVMNRVAQVKAQSQANTFFNGSYVLSDFWVKSIEKRLENAEIITVETIESIKENSYGFVQGIELLTVFDSIQEEGKQVFIYCKEIVNV